ncbi:MAG: Hsp20/alpha crystallin family protein [Candidatus Kerfeldbacteria bacterium]|nr:Hsp20/alpha crystallin family protein [Candidatus Kerfeldbacteria bacterium]
MASASKNTTNTKEKRKDEYEYDFTRDLAASNGKAVSASTPRAIDQNWLDDDDFAGQLAVDVYQTTDEIVIKSTIAGVKPEDIDISVNNDMITIRGKREKDHEVSDQDYFYRECYWGGFSRSIILPCDVKIDQIKATIRNGVLSVTLPKAEKVNKVTVVRVHEE